jgi:hypothetical protein
MMSIDSEATPAKDKHLVARPWARLAPDSSFNVYPISTDVAFFERHVTKVKLEVLSQAIGRDGPVAKRKG